MRVYLMPRRFQPTVHIYRCIRNNEKLSRVSHRVVIENVSRMIDIFRVTGIRQPEAREERYSRWYNACVCVCVCGGCIRHKKKIRAENTALAASKDTEESGERETEMEEVGEGIDEEADEEGEEEEEEEKKRRRWSGERGSPLSGPPAARGPRQPFTKNCNWKYFSSFFPEIIYESSTGQLARARAASRLFLPVSFPLAHSLYLSLLRLREDHGQGRNRRP